VGAVDPMSTSTSTQVQTRSSSPIPPDDSHCVICSKEYDRFGKKASAKVSTDQRQSNLMKLAQERNDTELLLKIQGYGTQSSDMVAANVCYHRSCMNKYTSQRSSTDTDSTQQAMEGPQQGLCDQAFSTLIDEIENPLIKELSGFQLSTLRDKYRRMLADIQVQNAGAYRSSY
jgi:hypothetical protein